MNKFVSAATTIPVETRTLNNMKAQESTMSSLVDLFYKIGASRGKNIIPDFEKAWQDDQDLALRVALWSRDVRGGAGERQLFRDVLQYMEKQHPEILVNTKFLELVPEIGRWDDLLVFNYDAMVIAKAYGLIRSALEAGNGLCAKWMPRKGETAVALRKFLDVSPKGYRKTLVGLSHTVEQSMCAKQYGRIEYSHVPSLAMSRYMKAFSKNDTDRFVAFRESLKKGETKINASAVFPYDIIKSLASGADKSVCDSQWDALPDYMNDAKVLPMVDVSGSMCCPAGNNPNLTCMDVAVSLGLYCADKNKGAFKDLFLTFSGKPALIKLKGSLSEKIHQMQRSDWAMNTDIQKAFKRILDTAVKGNVPQSDMPEVLLILSDMQFDQSTGGGYSWARGDNAAGKYDVGAQKLVQDMYEAAGYKTPVIVYWNLNAHDNAPVSFNKQGVALVSGFSPAIMKAVLAADFDDLSPESIMKDAICISRYDYS